MYIRYQHVRNIAIGLGVLSVIGCCGGCLLSGDGDAPASPTARRSVTSSSRPVASRRGGAPRGGVPSDAAIIERASGSATAKGKIKDAFPGPVKVNIYEDTGDASWDRIKIDRDRDETWDDQWVRKGGVWTREDGEQVWTGSAWSGPGAPVASRRGAATGGKAELAEVVEIMLHQRATAEKIKDLKKGGPKINLYDDDKNGTWDRAKVDHDRDETWDEAWTVKGGQVERKKEASGKVYVLKNDAWVEKR